VRLKGKVALVTGAASGIGLATARRFVEEGARVLATDLKVDDLEASECLSPFLLDVAQEEHWVAAIAAVLETFGRLDILVNNAGIGTPGPLVELSLANWRKVMAVNLDGVFLGIKHTVPAMERSGGGSIVNIASMLGHVATVNASAYCASKGGVSLLTKAAALEMAAAGSRIRVNSVHPGFIETPLLGSRLDADPERRALITGRTPLGRLGTAEDVAAAVLYLASDEAAFTTGSALVLDGGYTAQ
jgi:NAD(P)-dependent dehydrogenase (short-subunit alcohol dehydrogenase family)